MKDWVCGSHVKKAGKSLLPENVFRKSKDAAYQRIRKQRFAFRANANEINQVFNSLFSMLVQLIIRSSMYTPLVCANGSFRIFTHMTLFGALGVSQTTSLSAESTDDLLEFTCCDLHF